MPLPSLKAPATPLLGILPPQPPYPIPCMAVDRMNRRPMGSLFNPHEIGAQDSLMNALQGIKYGISMFKLLRLAPSVWHLLQCDNPD